MDVELALKISKLVHNECKDVPHDIGIKVEELVRTHQCKLKILNMPVVSGSLHLEFAEWIGRRLWSKLESKGDTYVEVDGWYDTYNYKAMKKPLTTQELYDLFISERGRNEA